MCNSLRLFFLLLISALTFSDGFFLRYDYSHLDNINEAEQIGLIEIDDSGYSMDLYVSVESNDQADVYWVVPLKQIPKSISLENAEKTDFITKVEDFKKEFKDKNTYNNMLREYFSELFISGFIVVNPLCLMSLPLYGISNVYLLGYLEGNGATGASGFGYSDPTLIVEDYYSFGQLGDAVVYSTESMSSLEKLFSAAGIQPSEELKEYLDKKIVLFKLRNVKNNRLVASFKFDNNSEVYFPSGTTKFLNPPFPEVKILVKIKKGINYDLSNISDSKSIVCKESINNPVNLDIHGMNTGKDFQYILLSSDALASHDITLKKTANSGFLSNLKELLALNNPFFVSLLIGITAHVAIILMRLRHIKLLNFTYVKRALLFMAIFAFFLETILLLLMAIASIMYTYADAAKLHLPLDVGRWMWVIIATIPVIFLIYLFFYWKKNLKQYIGITRWELFGVFVVQGVVCLFLFSIFYYVEFPPYYQLSTGFSKSGGCFATSDRSILSIDGYNENPEDNKLDSLYILIKRSDDSDVSLFM